MSLYNWCSDAGTNLTGSIRGWGNTESDTGSINETIFGTPADGADDNLTTYYGVKHKTSLWSHLHSEIILEAEFSEARNLDEVTIKVGEWGDDNDQSAYYWVSYYDGSWHYIAEQIDFLGDPDQTVTATWTAGWSNVTKIKVEVEVYYKYTANQLETHAYIYELQAWGTKYEDIGLRAHDGSDVINIGVEELDGHKLRIRKGGTTYGIPLVDTTDGDASGVRIHDGSSIKALPKID